MKRPYYWAILALLILSPYFSFSLSGNNSRVIAHSQIPSQSVTDSDYERILMLYSMHRDFQDHIKLYKGTNYIRVVSHSQELPATISIIDENGKVCSITNIKYSDLDYLIPLDLLLHNKEYKIVIDQKGNNYYASFLMD